MTRIPQIGPAPWRYTTQRTPKKTKSTQAAEASLNISYQVAVPDDTAILENCRHSGQDYFDRYFLTDLLARVKHDWEALDRRFKNSQRATGKGTISNLSHKPINRHLVDLLLRIYREHREKFVSSSDPDVKKIAAFISVFSVKLEGQDKRILSRLQSHLSPFFARLLHESDLAQPERSATFTMEGFPEYTMEKDFQEKKSPEQEAAAFDRDAENVALNEENRDLRPRLADAFRQIEVFEATVTKLRHQIETFLQSGNLAIAEHQNKLLQEIIDIFSTSAPQEHPTEQSGSERDMSHVLPEVAPELYRNRPVNENALQFLERVWGDYLKRFRADKDYLYQYQLWHFDPDLMQGLKTFFRFKKPKVSDYVPPKKLRTQKERHNFKIDWTERTPSIEEVQEARRILANIYNDLRV
jgi:hypothetical protein